LQILFFPILEKTQYKNKRFAKYSSELSFLK
jgi:hypothetical protein